MLHRDVSDIYKYYIEYCAENNYKVIKQSEFIKNLESINIHTQKDKKRIIFTESKENLKNNEALNKILNIILYVKSPKRKKNQHKLIIYYLIVMMRIIFMTM